MQLENKVAVVTGAGSGIGRAIALAFAREGAAVVVNYGHHPEAADDTVKDIETTGGKAVAVRADVTNPEDVRALIRSSVQELGHLDILVNNAGVEYKMPFLETPIEVWEKVIAVNLTGPWLSCREAAEQLVSQCGPGRIINISSAHEDLPMPTNSPYCAAKGGLRMLTRMVAVELAPTASPSTTSPPAQSKRRWTPRSKSTPTRWRGCSRRYRSDEWPSPKR